MKTIKAISITALLVIFGFQLSIADMSAQITQIKSSQLPALARSTVSKTWNGAPIIDAWRNKEGRRIEYKASVEDGSTMKFNANGQWIEVKSYGGVPGSLFPTALLSHLDKYFEGRYIVRATKTTKRYQVELNDGSKLEFNPKGVFQAFL